MGLFAMNTSEQDITKFTRFCLMYDRQAILPTEIAVTNFANENIE